MIEDTLRSERVAQEARPDYKNPERTPRARAADLLHHMTLEEKVAQMLCIWGERKRILFDEAGAFDPEQVLHLLPHGIGQIARISDIAGGLTPRAMAELANALQRFFVEHTRLGIPVIFHEECLHGLAAREATSYPQPIGLASTFDPELVEEIYSAIAAETRARGAQQALTPVVDVARDPRWGRVEETFGEDPYLVTRMGIAAVRGFQGDASYREKKNVIATLKHFAAHGQPESGMNCAPVNVSERLLRDTFLAPFRDVIATAGAMSVMPSYNEIDGVPSHASTWLLRDVLRGEWGFDGTVVSDYYAISELHLRSEATSHAVAHDKLEAARLSVEAGVNIEFPDPDCYPALVTLVQSGRIPESSIDALVAPLLEQKFRLGLFEDPYVEPELLPGPAERERDRHLALRAARETVTLLKNEGGVLPLQLPEGSTIAVIGPNADRVLLGGYSGTPLRRSTVLQGIREKVGSRMKILYSEGCKITIGGSWNQDEVQFPDPAEDRAAIALAVESALQADLVILAVGENEQTSREAWNRNHMGDRANLELIGRQPELVEAIAATGKPVVALLFNGRPNALGYLVARVAALLECWYLGQETGAAVAEILFGEANPGGKLPMSFPRSAGHLPCYYNYKPSARRGYLGEDVSPLFPFGFGMSYTTFALKNPRLEHSTIPRNGSTRVQVDVTNTGPRPGAEVVQMYIRDRFSSVTRPVKELKGFTRVVLEPGETKTITLPILPAHLAFTTLRREHAVEPGEFEIMIGTSSRDEDCTRLTLLVVA